MFRNRWLMLGAAAVVAGLVAWESRRDSDRGEPVRIDLVELLPQAERRAQPGPVDRAIRAVTATVKAESKPSILEQAHGRITYRLTLPPSAWFTAWVAVDASAWDEEGDGVLFRMGIADGKGGYVELLNQHVDPSANKSDRRWIPVAIDLGAWAGREVSLVLSTNASVPGKAVDLRHDAALWGAPAVTAGR